MKFLKILLFPVSVLYGFVTFVRNKLFDYNILKSISFKIPIISVGNIKVGGTGKTPHIEYLVRLLSDKHKTAILSRGYGRKTKGYILANNSKTAETIGDEPKQYQNKFKNIVVAVCEKRVEGVQKLLLDKPETEVVLLDDAFQHRHIKPKLSILIKEYASLSKPEFMLPTGTNREYKNGIKRADIVVISKSPTILSPLEKQNVLDILKPSKNQKIYFSSIKYGSPISLNKEKNELNLNKNKKSDAKKTALLITGIENPKPLVNFLTEHQILVKHLKYSDHYQYSVADLLNIKNIFDSIVGEKLLITTEKDATRLQNKDILELTKQLPIYYVPIEVEFNKQEKEQFNKQIIDVCQN